MTLTIQQAIDTILASISGAPFSRTVDTVKVGDTSQQVTSIVVTFLATCEVIEKSAQLGANFIITHEPTFYNHLDETTWLSEHPSYKAKRQLIEEKGIVIWRFHDYLHSLPPDSTLMGLIGELKWEASDSSELPYLCSIEPMSLLEIGQWVKKQLGLQTIRIVGDLTSICTRVAVLPGFPPAEWQIGSLGPQTVHLGGETSVGEQVASPSGFPPAEWQIGNLSVAGADVLITGEIHEWETSEYVRDANLLGFKKGLIVIGHAASEEPGMRYVIPWLKERLPGISIQFVSSGNPFQYL